MTTLKGGRRRKDQFDKKTMIYAAWMKGYLQYKLRPYQKDVYKSIREFEKMGDEGPPIIFLNLSRQIGKSFLDAIILLEDCIRTQHIYVTFVSSTKADAKDIIRKVLTEIMLDCPEELKPKWRQDDHMYLFSNGSELAVLGADDDDQVRRIRGRPRFKNIVDEARNIRDLRNLVDSVLIPSMVTTGGKIILSTTPADSPSHPSKHYYDICSIDHSLFEKTIWDAQKSCPEEFTQKRLDYLARASGGYGSTAWLREYEAKWVVESERAIVPEWTHIIESGPPAITHGDTLTISDITHDRKYPFYKKYVCMDMGVVDATWIGFGYYNFTDAQLVIEREWWGHGPTITTQLIADEVKKMEEDLWSIQNEESPLRIADNSNKQMLQDLSALYDISFTPVSKTKDGKVGSLQSHVNRLREWIKDGRILISHQCPFLLGCLESGIWTINRDKFDYSTTYKHFDAIAGLMYLLKYVDQYTNPLPSNMSILDYDPQIHVPTSEMQRSLKEKNKQKTLFVINTTERKRINRLKRLNMIRS